MAFDEQQMQMDQRLQLILSNKHARQAAVCRFPLRVFAIAREMNRAMTIRRLAPATEPDHLGEHIEYLEHQILQCFREEFGTDLYVSVETQRPSGQ